MDWKANATHAGNFIAAQRGFDEEEGVSLEIESGSGGTTTAEQVDLEKYELGLTSAASVLQTRNDGLDLRSYAAALVLTVLGMTLYGAVSGVQGRLTW